MVSGQIDLTDDQRKAIDIIMRGDNAFITGGAGTGKSVLIKEAIRRLERQHKNVVVCAPTGIAAVAIGGTTIHKAFGFTKGACITEKTRRLSVHTPKLIRMADVIVIDEVSMCRMDMMDAICESVLKAQKTANRTIQVIAVGDFCQLPPVIEERSGERKLIQGLYGTNVGLAFAFQAPGWRKMGFTNVELHDVVRQDDEDFIHYLNLLRKGDSSCLRYFNALASFKGDPQATKLFARNYDVDRMNKKELERIPGEMITYLPYYDGPQADKIYTAPSVSLKIGAKVIITTNQAGMFSSIYEKNRDLHNGIIGTVTAAKAYPDSPEDDYVVVSSGGRSYCINRKIDNIYSYRTDGEGRIHREIAGSVSSMPVKPGYAMTIHRSQGQTLDSVVLDPSCWGSGQLYVAISRLRSIEGLHLTRMIKAADIQLAPVVKEFYAHLDDHDYIPSWERALVDATAAQKASGVRNGDISSPPVGKDLMRQPVISEPKRQVLHEPGLSRNVPTESSGPDTVGVARLTAAPIEGALMGTADTKKEPDTCSRGVAKASFVNASLPQPVDYGAVTKYNEGSVKILPEEQADGEKNPPIKPEKPDMAGSASNTEVSALKNEKADSTPDVAKKTRGRPVRYSNNSKVCRIPVELVDEVKMMLNVVCPKGGINTRELQRFKQAIRELCEEQE